MFLSIKNSSSVFYWNVSERMQFWRLIFSNLVKHCNLEQFSISLASGVRRFINKMWLYGDLYILIIWKF